MRHLLRRLSLTRLFYHWTIHTSNLLHPDAGQDRTKLFLNNGLPIVTKHYREPETSHFLWLLQSDDQQNLSIGNGLKKVYPNIHFWTGGLWGSRLPIGAQQK